MSTAKLSGSLLERRDASVGLLDHPPFADLEGTKSLPYATGSAIGPGNDQAAAATWGSASAPPPGRGSRRLGSMLGFAAIVCGVAVVTAAGTIFSMHRAEQSISNIEPQSHEASASVTSVAPSSVIESSTVPQVAATLPSTAAMLEQSPTQLMTAAVPAIAAPTAAPVETRLTPQEVAALLTRGDALLANSDIVSARLCYERAAEGGNAQAALRLGESYDPAFLVQTQLNGIRADKNAAARWYRRAIELGANEADTLLKSLGKP
jgi:hypothetical protein